MLMIIAELIGYVASILIAFSLMMKNIIKLRLLNLVGAIAFTIYGFVIKAYPVLIVNAIIAFINIYYLYELYSRRDLFHLQVMRKGSQFAKMFIEFYRKDIDLFFPNIDEEEILNNPKATSIMIFRNLISVGLFIYEIEDSQIYIHVDYVTKEYRDLKNAQFLFGRMEEIFKNQPVKTLVTRSYYASHTKYLIKMGFKACADEPDKYVMNLNDFNGKNELKSR
jgi:hypothetical protein